MRLGLSSAAAPDAALDDLLLACQRRGITALVLEELHGHGLDPTAGATDAAFDARRLAADAGIALAGFRLASWTVPSAGREASAIAEFARALGSPAIVPAYGDVPRAAALAASLERAGAGSCLALPTTGAVTHLDVLDARPEWRGLSLAWDADPGVAHLSDLAAGLLSRAGSRLRHVRLLGGGPEATAQEGQGIGALMARLALVGFSGTLALAPSSPRYRVVWDAWLGRRGGWGCGGASEDRELVRLGSP